jgi:YbbR domain-containing protein
VNVRVDKVVSRGMPVRVDHGVVPDGFEVGPTEVDPARVLVRGAGTRVALVTSVGARVPIDASGLNVDQDVLLEAVDDSGAIVDGVQIEPATARVRIDVARRLSYATIPLVPRIVGQPADGQVIGSVSVEPLTVTVAGEEPVIRELTSVSTGPIDLTDRRDRVETTVELVLPVDVTVDGEASAVVTVELRPGATPSPHAGGRWDLLW